MLPMDLKGEAPKGPQNAEAQERDGGSVRQTPGGRPLYHTYAALDLGTNNCRLLVARPAREGFRIVDAFSRIVRLGEGVSASGRLSEQAVRRTLAALEICRDKMDVRGVSRARLIATEACRMAENGPDFIARVREETGLALEIIDRAYILHDGQVLMEGLPHEIVAHEGVRRVYLGEKFSL